MGCLLRRSNGVYYGVYSSKGKRVWRSLKSRDLDQARNSYECLSREVERNTVYRLSHFLKDFQEIARLNFQEGTIAIYVGALKTFIRLCGDEAMGSYLPIDVERFKALRSREVSGVTVNIDLRTLRAAFNEALRLKFIQENPFAGMKLVRVPEKEGASLSEPDFQRLLLMIDDTEFRNLVIFAAYTMLRLGELVHLEWDDIDLRSRMIHVKNKKEFRVKGGRSRHVPMNEWVFTFLSERRRKSRLVFANSLGAGLIGSSVSHKFKKYVRRAELDDTIHFHSLRHTGVSFLANKGVPQEYIRRIAGHTSVRTTDIYTHIRDETLFSAISALPNFN